MHLDVVPALRCPREHEESGLVLVADDTLGRHVVSGLLGCPICEAEYPIRSGVAYFTDSVVRPTPRRTDDPIRTAAMLGLTEPGGIILLGGQWASVADAISEIAEALVLVVDPPSIAEHAERVSVLYAGDRLPIAQRALRAAAVDAPYESIVGLLGEKARLAATTGVPVPAGVGVIARDTEYWVGEVSAPPPRPVSPTPLRIVRR